MTSFRYDDPKYQCLCGIHVEKASLLVASINAVLSFVLFATNILVGKEHFLAATMFVWGLLYMLVIWGHKVRKPALFLPYLIVQALGLIVIVVCVIVLLITHPGRSSGGPIPLDPETQQQLRGTAIVKPFAILVAFVLTGWFYTLIYRGWAFLKDQLASERLQQDGFTPVAAQQPFLNNKN